MTRPASQTSGGMEPRADEGRGRRLYRELRRILMKVESFDRLEPLVRYLLEALVRTSRAENGVIRGGRLYVRDEDVYRLESKYGDAGPVELGFTVPADYAPVLTARKQGWVLMRPTDPGYDPRIEAPIGMETFAAVVLGLNQDYMLSFSLNEPVPDDEIIYTLVAVRQIIDLALRQKELSSFIESAREIQTSLLPREAPRLAGYDIAFFQRPAEVIGGDVYDFIPLGKDILGVAVGDATGHGLPAALQARDVIIGLRMGVEENLKIVKTIEKLARILQQTSMTSRFISLFYCEIEVHGYLVYVNAGHVPPFIVRDSDAELVFLKEGGPVLGLPVPLEYRRAFGRLRPGDVLVMYTDGIVEARDHAQKEFGWERLAEVVRRHRRSPAADIVDRVRRELDRHMGDERQLDDQTLVLIRRN